MRKHFIIAALLFLAPAVYAASPVPANTLPTSYIACGCGCCLGAEPKQVCLYKAKGDSLMQIIQRDTQTKANAKQCALAGCAQGTEYRYCDQ